MNITIPLNIIPNIQKQYKIENETSQNSEDRKLSIYVHIPFCEAKCNFCPIETFKNNDEIRRIYIERLLNEIDRRLQEKTKTSIDCIHFGGGTPSLLSIDEINLIVEAIISRTDCNDAEILIEVHPKYMSNELIDYMVALPRGTMNFGIQSFNDMVLKSTNRDYSCNELLKKLYLVKCKNMKYGIDYIADWTEMTNIDLKNELILFNEIEPDHISQYPLRKLRKFTSDEERRKIYINELFMHRFYELGYTRYSIYHYEKPNSQINLYGRCQLDGKNWLGIGANAYSYYNNTVILNPRLKDYIENNHLRYTYDMSKQENLLWKLIYYMRKMNINKNTLYKRFQFKYDDIENFIDELYKRKYIISKDDISLSWKGIINLNSVEKIIIGRL